MKSKIGNQILAFGCGAGILISGIGVEIAILKNEIAKAKSEIEIQKMDCVVEIIDLNWEFEIENEQSPFYELSAEDRIEILNIVSGEAGNEPLEGKMAVAQCLLNAMIKEQMSANEIKIKYKYSGYNDNLEFTNPDMYAEVVEAVDRVFINGEFVSENPILFFYAPKYAKGRWHNTLPHDQTIGGHKFFYLEEDVTADWFLNLKEGKTNGD